MMFRISTIATVALLSAMGASAGQIQVGGVTGLTSSYITSGCSSAGPCVAGSVGAATEQNYDNVLFSGALNGSTAPTPYSTYNQTTAEQGTITDSAAGVTFSMIDDGTTGGNSNNDFGLPHGSNTTGTMLTIPIGVYGVSDVFTMLDTELANASSASTGFRDLTIIFNFGTASNSAPTAADTVKLALTNTNDSSTPSGMIQNSVSCTPLTGACNGNSTPASGYPATTTTSISNTESGGSGGSVNEINDNLYLNAFTSLTSGSATGNVVLNDEGFYFNDIALGGGLTNLDTYLVSIQIQEVDSANTSAVAALSAITLDTAPTPEPSTVFLLLTGIAAIGIARFRRSKA